MLLPHRVSVCSTRTGSVHEAGPFSWTLRFHGDGLHGHGPPLALGVAGESAQNDTMSNPHTGRIAAHTMQQEYRKLPAVDTLLREPAIELLASEYGSAAVTAVLRDLLDAARDTIAGGGRAPAAATWPARLAATLEERHAPSLRPVINATGVIVHTNLGRAPLSEPARQAVDRVSRGYSNLEYTLDAGARGSRHDHARARLRALTGAEDAMVVNNNAAAVYLTLAALCAGREVLVSRGQLVEIGGGFRIPDVLRAGGARLVEVGTTNRTHVRDYENARGPETAALMRIHSSNFRQLGFVAQPTPAEMAAVAHAPTGAGAPAILIDDLGSGTLLETARFGLAPEPMIQESLAAGADIVTFSGDKLLGGPQAGLIVGKAELIETMRRHPMARALRVDKMTLAALDATLLSYQRDRALVDIPIWQMIGADVADLAQRARTWRSALETACADTTAAFAVEEGESAVGGGSLPGETLPTRLLAVTVPDPELTARRLRTASSPVVCRIQRDTLLFDPRTVLPAQEETLLATLSAAVNATATMGGGDAAEEPRHG